jgi:hypothetical protein
MTHFTVTYEIVTEDSAENGEAVACGALADKLSLRDALSYVNATDSCHCSQSSVEASDSRVCEARWFTVYNSANYLSGNYENRSLHVPAAVTASSRLRIARILGVRA